MNLCDFTYSVYMVTSKNDTWVHR